MATLPEVTVVMAARDAEATIAAAIKSVVAQTFTGWELLVVDDASDDRTGEIARSIADPRIRVLTNDAPRGAAEARNRAIRQAAGGLIAIADADDLSLPGRLAAQVREFADDPSLAVLGAQLVEFGPWGERDGAARFPTDADDVDQQFARGRMGIAHPAAMFRKDLALAVGGYDERLLRSEDLALFLRMRPAVMRALPEQLVRYRTAEGVTLRYVWREVHYARLARAGSATGGASAQLALTTISALRSWTVRRLRERAARMRAMARGPR